MADRKEEIFEMPLLHQALLHRQRLARFGCKSLRQSSTAATTAPAREFTYFGNLEVKGNVGIVRLDGPNKMNTISRGMQAEVFISNLPSFSSCSYT